MYSSTAYIFDVLPWWLAVPLLELAVLVAGMVLDETYVNRVTVLTGAIALAIHSVVAGGTGFMVSIYLDVGLVVGAYGLYSYVVDGYVGNPFRVAAYFFYSPLAVFLVIVFPDIAFPVALVVAGYANLQLMAALEPTTPYYFGPENPDEFEEALAETESETTTAEPTVGTEVTAGESTEPADRPGAEPATAGSDSTERGILPEFMRRL